MNDMAEKLATHANSSKEMSSAANRAVELAALLSKINKGLTFDHERDAVIRDIQSNWAALSEYMKRFEPAEKPVTVGPITMDQVFMPADINNLGNLQAVMDAVEVALQKAAGNG